MKTSAFFRWMPTAITLWLFAAIFAAAAAINLVNAKQAARGQVDSYYAAMLSSIKYTHGATHWFLRGALTNAAVAILCLLGWQLMRQRISTAIAFGGIFVIVAAYIICHRSIVYLFLGAGFAYWGDLVIELPLLLYVITYAYFASRKAAA